MAVWVVFYVGEFNSILASLLGFLRSLDHLLRPHEHYRRNRKTNLLRGLEIDYQLELRWLLHGQIAGLCSLKDFVHVVCDAPVDVREVRPVVHETTSLYSLFVAVHRR
jgi:hypothetical protein